MSDVNVFFETHLNIYSLFSATTTETQANSEEKKTGGFIFRCLISE